MITKYVPSKKPQKFGEEDIDVGNFAMYWSFLTTVHRMKGKVDLAVSVILNWIKMNTNSFSIIKINVSVGSLLVKKNNTYSIWQQLVVYLGNCILVVLYIQAQEIFI